MFAVRFLHRIEIILIITIDQWPTWTQVVCNKSRDDDLLREQE